MSLYIKNKKERQMPLFFILEVSPKKYNQYLKSLNHDF